VALSIYCEIRSNRCLDTYFRTKKRTRRIEITPKQNKRLKDIDVRYSTRHAHWIRSSHVVDLPMLIFPCSDLPVLLMVYDRSCNASRKAMRASCKLLRMEAVRQDVRRLVQNIDPFPFVKSTPPTCDQVLKVNGIFPSICLQSKQLQRQRPSIPDVDYYSSVQYLIDSKQKFTHWSRR
jgi:hypothetical protein